MTVPGEHSYTAVRASVTAVPHPGPHQLTVSIRSPMTKEEKNCMKRIHSQEKKVSEIRDMKRCGVHKIQKDYKITRFIL